MAKTRGKQLSLVTLPVGKDQQHESFCNLNYPVTCTWIPNKLQKFQPYLSAILSLFGNPQFL